MKKHKHTLRKRCTATLERLARCAAALLLVFSMLLAVLPVLAQGESVLADSDIPEALSRAQLEEHGAVQRLYDEEQGDNDFVFLNRDGTITRYDFSVSVKYKDETGKYRDKNNKIKDWNGEYGNTAGDVELRFPKQLNFIKIKYNGHTVRIKPVTSASPGHLPAMVQGSSVSYAGAFGEGTELRYTSTMSGIKEDIILQNSAQGNSFSFEVRTGGLELRQQDGVWGIYDGETAVFSFGDLEVTDSFTGQDEATDDWDAHRTYAQAQVSALSGDKYLFTITVPQEYLQAESTVYPVYVDPTFNVSRSYIQDTYIAKGYTNNYVNSSLVAVGYGTNAKNVRTLAKISDLFGGQTIHGRVTAAYYSMYCTSDYSSTPTVDAYMINSSVSWNPSAVTWQNSADMLMNAATKISTLTVKGAGRYNFDITSAYQAWQTGTANNGIMLRMTTEVSGKYRQFASANVSDSSKLAYVTVTYQDVALGITISPEEAYMTVGEVKRISALAHSVNETITWSSDNPSVATVDANGNVTAHSAGDVTITATGTYGGSSATCGITVVAKGVESVTLPYRTLYLAKGKSLNVSVRIAPSDASVQQVTWSSSNTSVVTVNNGLLRAVAPGTAIITVRSEQGGKQDGMTVVVPAFEDGSYYFQNKATMLYMDIQNASTGTANMQQISYSGGKRQRWKIELRTDGYYKISSPHSGLYLSVENNSSAQDAAVKQKAFNNGSGQLWKVELLNGGAYKLTPKSGESSNRVLASAYYSSVGDGIAVQQRLFVDDTNYKDEWILDECLDDYSLVYIGYEDGDANMPQIGNYLDKRLNKENLYGDINYYIDKQTMLRELTSAKVVSCITHGAYDRIRITDNNTITMQDIDQLDNNAMEGVKLVLLSACNTGARDNGNGVQINRNFADAVFEKGADTVIGFSTEVKVVECNAWTEFFMEVLSIGATIENAISYADTQMQQWRENLWEASKEDISGQTKEEFIAEFSTITAQSRYIRTNQSNLNYVPFS